MSFAILGVIVAIVAAIIDGIGSRLITAQKGCYNINTSKYSGNAIASNNAATCAPYYIYLNTNCICTTEQSFVESTTDAAFSSCTGFNLAFGENCNGILTTYQEKLEISTIVLVCIIAVLFFYSILTCAVSCVCCCNAQNYYHNREEHENVENIAALPPASVVCASSAPTSAHDVVGVTVERTVIKIEMV